MERYSFENAQDEALKMQEKIKNGAGNYSEAEKLIDKEINNSVHNMGELLERMQSVKVGSLEHEILRKEYREIVEINFQKFISEHGAAKFDNPQQFLFYVDKLYEFLKKEEISPKAVMDMGFRFNIETALSNSNISEGNKQILKDYFINAGPYNGMGFENADDSSKKVAEQSEDKKVLIDDLSAVIKNSQILDKIARGPRNTLLTLFALRGESTLKVSKTINEKNIDIFKGADSQLVNIWKEDRGVYRGAVEHPNIYSSEVVDFRRYISKTYKIDYNFEEEDEEQSAQEMVTIFKKDFGIDLEVIVQEISK